MNQQTGTERRLIVARVKALRAAGFDLYVVSTTTAMWLLPVCNH
jgi:hypothetical protein